MWHALTNHPAHQKNAEAGSESTKDSSKEEPKTAKPDEEAKKPKPDEESKKPDASSG